jgi:N-acetylneuraminic acid mutarotase
MTRSPRTRSTRTGGHTRRRRWRSWLPGLALMPLVALAAPNGGPGRVHPRLELSASTVTAPSTGWSQLPPLQVARAGLDVATVNGDILAIGGFNPVKPGVFNLVEAHRADAAQSWRPLTPMPTGRANAAAAELGGSVYVVGGFDDEQTFDVVEKYDPATGSWSPSPRLPAARGAAAAASLGGLLYVAGGSMTVGPDDDEITASVVAFNPVKQSWASVAPMPTARWRLRLVAAGGQLYAIGGQSAEGNTLSTVERYDPSSNTWTTVAPMNQDRAVPGVVAVNQGSRRLIVVVGGCQFAEGQRLPFLQSTEVYNLDTGQWLLLPAQLPLGRCSLGAAVTADGSVLAIGGGTDAKGIVIGTSEVDALRF